MQKINKVFYPRLSGIGDFIPALSMMVNHFKGEPFTIVAGSIIASVRENSPHYVNFYKELASMVSCCQALEILNHTTKEENEIYASSLQDSDTVSWLVMSDEPGLSHGYKYWGENVYDIMENFSKYFSPKYRPELDSVFKADKVNICFQLRKAKVAEEQKKNWHPAIFTRNVDLDKWAEFILWIAEDENVNLIAIGESDPNSPWYIPLDEIPELVNKDNIQLAPWDFKTSLSEDMYIIKRCDLFLGAHSGPQQMAWSLAKPAICFDYKRRDQAVIHGVEKHHCPVYQKICWGIQSLNEMKELWTDYYHNIFEVYRGMDLSQALAMKLSIFDKNYQEMLNCLAPSLDKERHQQLEQAKISMEQVARSFEAFYFVAGHSYRLAHLCLKNKFYDVAIAFLKECWGYSVNQADDFFVIIDELDSNGYGDMALDFLRKYIFYFNSIAHPEDFATANNKLIEKYIERKRYNEISNYCMNVFGVLPDHLPTLELIKQV